MVPYTDILPASFDSSCLMGRDLRSLPQRPVLAELFFWSMVEWYPGLWGFGKEDAACGHFRRHSRFLGEIGYVTFGHVSTYKLHVDMLGVLDG